MTSTGKVVAAVLLAGVLAGGYFVYQNPKVQELFASRPRSRPLPAPVLHPQPVKKKPDPAPATATPAAKPKPRPTPPKPRPTPPPETAPVQNQMDNQQVAHILLQILAAKKLAYGISLSVTDTQIEVNGETASKESRAEILQVLDKGRESRQIVADRLTIRPAGSQL